MTPPPASSSAPAPRPRNGQAEAPDLRRGIVPRREIRVPKPTVSDEQLAEAERIMGVAPIAGRLRRMWPGY